MLNVSCTNHLQTDELKNVNIFNKNLLKQMHPAMLITLNLQVAATRSSILEP